MIKFKPAVLCAALSIIIASSAFSQSETVILYNSQPVKVDLTDNGKIQSFYGVVQGFMEGYDLSTDIAEVTPSVIEEPIFTPSSKNANYAVVSIERVELNYKPNFALLDKSIIDELNEISAKLKADPNTKILLTAHTNDSVNNKLSSNRLASAISYLEIKGIKQNRIQSEVLKSESLLNVVTVNYLN